MDKTKICMRCGLKKPVSEFDRCGEAYQSWCRACFKDAPTDQQEEGYNSILLTRVRLGLSQAVMAKRLGVSQSFLSMCENGQRKIPASVRAKLEELQ